MKILLILMLVGCTSATLLEAVERETRSTLKAFTQGLHAGTRLHKILDIEESEEVRRLERKIKEELENHIGEIFRKFLEKIEDEDRSNHKVNERTLNELKNLRKVSDPDAADHKISEEHDVLRKRASSDLKELLEDMINLNKRSEENEIFESVLGDLSLRDMFIKLKNMILEKMDIGALKKSLSKVVGQGTQKLCEWLVSKGKEKIDNFFDRVLDSEDVDKRASEDRLEEVKEYLQKLDQDMERKLTRFREWLHDLINEGLEGAKEGLLNIQDLLKNIKSHINLRTKNSLRDALDFITESKHESDFINDMKQAIKQLINKKD